MATTILGENGALSVSGEISVLTGIQPGIEMRDFEFDLVSYYGQAKGAIANFQSSLSLEKAWEGNLQFSLTTSRVNACVRPTILNLTELSPPKELYNFVAQLRPEQIDIQDVLVDVSEKCNATIPLLQIASASIASNEDGMPMVAARGQLAHLPWSLDSSLSSKNSTLPTLQGNLGQMSWSITPEYDQSAATLHARLNVHSEELYEALAITPLPFKAFGPFTMQTRWTLNSNDIQWQLTKLEIANNHWQGRGKVNLASDKPHLTTELSIDALNLRQLQDWTLQAIDFSKLSLTELTRVALHLTQKSEGELNIKALAVDYDSILKKEQAALNFHWLDADMILTASQSIQEKSIQINGHGQFVQDSFSWKTNVTIPPLDTEPFSLPSELLVLSGSTGPTTIDGELKINTETGQIKDATGQLQATELSVTIATSLLPHTYSLESISMLANTDGGASIEINGIAMEKPSKLSLVIGSWQTLLKQREVPGELKATLGDMSLSSTFDLAASLSEARAKGSFELSSLNEHTPSSPLNGSGRLTWQDDLLKLDVDSVNKGQSRGEANVVIQPLTSPISVTADIHLQQLHLEDFGINLDNLANTDNLAKIPGEADKLLAVWVAPIRQALHNTQGQVRLSVDKLSLDKMGGNMQLGMQFGQGKAEILPSKIQGDRGGFVDFSSSFDLSDDQLMAITTQATGKDIYYHYDHPALKKISGYLNTDIDLNTIATPTEGELLKALQGNISFMSQPEFGEFMLFDLWGGGFIQTLAQSVGAIEKSKINCSAGLLTFNDGQLKINPVIIDSTRVRVNASLAANLINGEIEGYAKPEPKDPALLRNWLPMIVSGTLTEPFVRPQEGAGVVTAARWLYAIPAYVLDLATVDEMAEDGRPDCEKVFRYRTQPAATAN